MLLVLLLLLFVVLFVLLVLFVSFLPFLPHLPFLSFLSFLSFVLFFLCLLFVLFFLFLLFFLLLSFCSFLTRAALFSPSRVSCFQRVRPGDHACTRGCVQAIRVIRPLRLLKRNKGMKLVLNAIGACIMPVRGPGLQFGTPAAVAIR